ncbi:MAG: sodium:solute symporter [Phycisphaerae bacterium]|nr:sodium:solute symporter [Phycisphaerae bacterium]
MQYLNTLDYAVIGIYCVVLIAIALYLKTIASRSLEDYFLGGRQLPWWALGISGMTNFLDMTGTMVIVSFLFLLGPRGLYVEFRGGAVLVLAFMMLWTGKWHYRSQCMTGAEWNIYRFGNTAGAKLSRIIAVIGGTAGTVAMLAYLVKGSGTFLAMFFDLRPEVCALIMVILTTLYTLVSGFYGVVYVDLFQSGIILLVVVVITTMAVSAVVGYDGDLGTLAEEITGNSQWTSAVPHTQTAMPEGYKEFEPLLMVAAFYLLRNILGGLGTGADPRYFGARNERECGKLTFFWTWLMTFRWPLMMGFAILGLFLVRESFPDQQTIPQASAMIREAPEVIERFGLADEQAGDASNAMSAPADNGTPKAKVGKNRWEDLLSQITTNPERFPNLVAQLKNLFGEEDWRNKTLMIGYEGIVNPERILPAVILKRIPMGIRGLFVVALVAAAMSTFSPTVNMCVALFTRDIWQGFIRPKASNRELLTSSYIFGILLVGGGMAMAYTSDSINDLWDWIIMGLTAGGAIPGLLRLYWWRFNAGGANLGTVVGITVAVLQRIFLPQLGPMEKFSLVTVLSLIGTVIGTYMFAPTDRRVLEFFYKTTRPFGLWGPLKKTLAPEVQEAVRREHFFDLICLPFALGWQVTLFLLPLVLLVGNFQAAISVGVIFTVCLVFVYVLWYRRLPPDRPREIELAELRRGMDITNPDTET